MQLGQSMSIAYSCYLHNFCFLFLNTVSATGSARQQTGSAFALLCHNVAPPLISNRLEQMMSLFSIVPSSTQESYLSRG